MNDVNNCGDLGGGGNMNIEARVRRRQQLFLCLPDIASAPQFFPNSSHWKVDNIQTRFTTVADSQEKSKHAPQWYLAPQSIRFL